MAVLFFLIRLVQVVDIYRFFWYLYRTLIASVAQSAERNHGKVEVSGSIPLGGL